jgi:hypothetical protein
MRIGWSFALSALAVNENKNRVRIIIRIFFILYELGIGVKSNLKKNYY